MGRPNKQTVDYFPHFVGGSRKTIFLLEDSFGNDGYAFWFKLLELLCSNDGHCYDISDAANRRYMCAYTSVDEEAAVKILGMLADLGNIDTELFTEHRIIWCQSLVDNLKDVYNKRTTPLPVKPFFGDNRTENPQKSEKTDAEPEEQEKPKGKKKAVKTQTPKEEKIKYADFVSLTKDERDKLVAEYGEEGTKRLVEILDNYKGQNGKTYKSDYRAILNWVVGRMKEEQERKAGGYGRGETHYGDSKPGDFKPSGGFKKQ